MLLTAQFATLALENLTTLFIEYWHFENSPPLPKKNMDLDDVVEAIQKDPGNRGSDRAQKSALEAFFFLKIDLAYERTCSFFTEQKSIQCVRLRKQSRLSATFFNYYRCKLLPC